MVPEKACKQDNNLKVRGTLNSYKPSQFDFSGGFNVGNNLAFPHQKF